MLNWFKKFRAASVDELTVFGDVWRGDVDSDLPDPNFDEADVIGVMIELEWKLAPRLVIITGEGNVDNMRSRSGIRTTFFKKVPIPASFRPFLITTSTIHIEKSIDGLLGTQTRSRSMVGIDETMELWRLPQLERFLFNIGGDFTTEEVFSKTK